jgi:hypothetical protein
MQNTNNNDTTIKVINQFTLNSISQPLSPNYPNNNTSITIPPSLTTFDPYFTASQAYTNWQYGKYLNLSYIKQIVYTFRREQLMKEFSRIVERVSKVNGNKLSGSL